LVPHTLVDFAFGKVLICNAGQAPDQQFICNLVGGNLCRSHERARKSLEGVWKLISAGLISSDKPQQEPGRADWHTRV